MPGNPQRPTPKKPMPEKSRRPVSDQSAYNNPHGPIEDPPAGGQKPGEDEPQRDRPPATNS